MDQSSVLGIPLPTVLYGMAMFMIANGPIVILLLTYLRAPYGRYSSAKGVWGFDVPGKLAWIVQAQKLSWPADTDNLARRPPRLGCRSFSYGGSLRISGSMK